MEAHNFLLLLLLWVTFATADPPLKYTKLKNAGDRSPLLRTLSSLADKQKNEIRAECIENYRPCTCQISDFPSSPNAIEIEVFCTDVSTQRVQEVFQNIGDPEISLLYYDHWNDFENVVSLPGYFLGNTSAKEIKLQIPTSLHQNLVVDPFAFRASQNYTINFEIRGYDLSLQHNFSFLDGFNSLEGLSINFAGDISALEYFPPLPSLQSLKLTSVDRGDISVFQYLPPLPSLQTLGVFGCTELNTFPNLTPATLKNLRLENDFLDDEKTNSIITSLVASTSADSLELMSFMFNNVNTIPNLLPSSFTNLSTLYFSHNNISHLPYQSLVFASPVTDIDLSYNALTTIEGGAFRGNFRVATVSMTFNYLELFEEDVFKDMLQQMAWVYPIVGHLLVDGNPFICGCDIAWLIRDNRNFLPAVDGTCGENSPYPNTPFERLKIESFAECP